MNFAQANHEDGVTERFFELNVAGKIVPGVVWAPEGARGPRPLLLMGHGGGKHKMFPPFAASGRRYARDLQYAVVAIDAPSHGARATPEESARTSETVRQQLALGDGLGGEALALMMKFAVQAVPEWRAVIDAVQALDFVGASGPVAYVGLSLGAMIGIPLVASDSRIKAAVLGLAGLRAETELLESAARQLSVPVEFLAQWDDELVPRGNAIALYNAIGSAEKTLHANPGGHKNVPLFERAGWVPFFIRHLGSVPAPA